MMIQGRVNQALGLQRSAAGIAACAAVVVATGCGGSARKPSVLDYSSETRLVVESSSTDGAYAPIGLRIGALRRAAAALERERFAVRLGEESLIASRVRHGHAIERYDVSIGFPEGSVLSGKTATGCVVDVQWTTDVIAKHPGIGVAEAHCEAERIRRLVVDAMLDKTE